MELVFSLTFAALLIYLLGREHGARQAAGETADGAGAGTGAAVAEPRRDPRRLEIQYRCRGCGYRETDHQTNRPDLSVGDVYLAPGGEVMCPSCRQKRPMVVQVVGESAAPPA